MKIFNLFTFSHDGKFGAIQGVYVPNVLQMIGAILFLRFGWILGHVGMTEMGIIIALSSSLLFLTSLSMAAIVSNMSMRAGGAYYLISRALGVELGSAVGILQVISQLCSIALCVTGFSVSLYEIFPFVSLWAIKAGTLSVLVLISYLSTHFAMKTQLLIFMIVMASIGAIFLGFTGIPDGLASVTEHSSSLSFWVAFSLFFPATTGIENGMAMSGDLRNPARSLSIGTVLSVVTVFFFYLGFAFFLSSHVPLEYLKAHPFLLYHTNQFSFLILAGVWAATLSSSLGSILCGPRVIQAIAKDRVLPQFLANGAPITHEPRVATLVIFILGLALTLFTDINQIIPMLTMSCLISYALINVIAFFQIFLQNPSWRPTVQIPWGIPLLGSLGCFAAMFMISPGVTFMVFSLVALFCLWTSSRKVKGNWNDIRYSILSYFVHQGAVSLSTFTKDAKNWRPQILVFFDSGIMHKNLAFFAHSLNQEKGLLTFATHSPGGEMQKMRLDLEDNLKGWKIFSHLHISREANPALAAEGVIENYGFGQIKPNTVIFQIPTTSDLDSFIRCLLSAHAQEKNVILLNDDPNKDFVFADPKQQNKEINLWWRGNYPGNFELCLAMAFLLQQSKFWCRSKIAIKMITKEESLRAELIEQFQKYYSRLRIKNLEFTPICDPEGDFFSSLAKSSQNASLTFIGLRKPDALTSVDEYKEYYTTLLENTKSLGNVAYVLSGEKIQFRKIFL